MKQMRIERNRWIDPIDDFVRRYGRATPRWAVFLTYNIDLERFSPKVAPIDKYNDGKLNILFVSRLEKRKGAKYLLRAYRKAKHDCPPSRLILVGPGWQATIEQLYRSFDGYIPPEQRRWVTFAADVAQAVDLLQSQP